MLLPCAATRGVPTQHTRITINAGMGQASCAARALVILMEAPQARGTVRLQMLLDQLQRALPPTCVAMQSVAQDPLMRKARLAL